MLTRILAAVVAACFGIVSIQPSFADPCPHHEPALAVLAQSAGIAASHEHGMPAADMHGQRSEHHSSPDHGCQCLGACCTASPAGIASLPWTPVRVAVSETHVARSVAVAVRTWKSSAPHALPFSTAPPGSLLA